MASIHRSQLRLQQVTGSFGDGALQINDQISRVSVATGSIPAASLRDSLSFVAAAVQKIHGTASFSEARPGEFYQNLLVGPATNPGLGAEKIQFRDADIFIHSSVDGQLDIDADGEVEIATAKFDVDASSDFNIQGGAVSKVHTTAGNLFVDAAAANLILDGHTGVDIDASNSGKVTIDGVGGIDIGVATDVPVDINASTLQIDASDDAHFIVGNNKTLELKTAGGGAGSQLFVTATGTGASALRLASSGSLDIDAADNITVDAADLITLQTADNGADGKISLKSATEGSNLAIHISGSASSQSIVRIDAGVLEMGATSIEMTVDDYVIQSANSDKPDVVIKNTNDDGAGASLAFTKDTNNSAGNGDIAGTIHFNADDSGDNQTEYARIQAIAADVTNGSESGRMGFSVATTATGALTEIISVVGGANAETSTVTIEGDLQVKGDTVTLDTQNLLVEDPIIVLNKAATGNNNQGGIAIEQGKATGTGDMVFGRVDADTWGVGTKDTAGGTATTVADMALTAFRAGKLEIDSANDHIDVSTDLTFTAAADIKLAPGGGQVVPNANNTVGLGIANTAEFADLFLGDGAEISFLNNSVKLTHVKGGHGALRMSTTSSIEFNDAAEGVRSNTSRLVLRSNARDYLFANTDYVQNGVLTDIDGAGTLEFTDVFGDTQKVAAGVFQAIASGSAPASYTLDEKPIGFVDPLFLISTRLPASEVSKRADVFVNGQMLLSGSSLSVGAGEADYIMHPFANVATIQILKAVRNNAVSDGGNLVFTAGANDAGGGFDNHTGLTVAIAQNDTTFQIATKILTQLRDTGGSGGHLGVNECFIPAQAQDTIVLLNRSGLGTVQVDQSDIVYADGTSLGIEIRQNAAHISPQFAFDLEVDDTIAVLVR